MQTKAGGIGFVQYQQSSSNKLRLKLDITDPNKRDDGYWEASLIAVVSDDNNDPREGVDVICFRNGNVEVGRDQTNEDGRVTFEIADLTKGNYLFEAQISGTTTRVRKSVVVKEERKIPAELVVSPTRVKNHIHFFVAVFDEEKKGIEAKIVIVDSGETEPITKDTHENGELDYPIDLKPREEREIQILVAGYGDKFYRNTFYGRKD